MKESAFVDSFFVQGLHKNADLIDLQAKPSWFALLDKELLREERNILRYRKIYPVQIVVVVLAQVMAATETVLSILFFNFLLDILELFDKLVNRVSSTGWTLFLGGVITVIFFRFFKILLWNFLSLFLFAILEFFYFLLKVFFLLFQLIFPFVRISVQFDFFVEKFSKGSSFGVAVNQEGNKLKP
jgi:hypothetical protein